MKKILLLIALLFTGAAVSAENLVTNGDFEKKTRKWKGDLDAAILDGNGVGVIELHERKTQEFSQQFDIDKGVFEVGITFRYKLGENSACRGFQLICERPDGSYTYRDIKLKKKPGWHTYPWSFSRFEGFKDIIFKIEVRQGSGTIYFDDISIVSQ